MVYDSQTVCITSPYCQSCRPVPFQPCGDMTYDAQHNMDRRQQGPETHPPVSGFSCPDCGGTHVRLATVADRFFYLRCDACEQVWSHPERRQMQRRLTER